MKVFSSSSFIQIITDFLKSDATIADFHRSNQIFRESAVGFINNVDLLETISYFENHTDVNRTDVQRIIHFIVNSEALRFENRDIAQKAYRIFQESRLTFTESFKRAINSEYLLTEIAVKTG